MKLVSRLLPLVLAIVLIVALTGCDGFGALKPQERLQVATTTSLYDTGLWGYLEPRFDDEYGVELEGIKPTSQDMIVAYCLDIIRQAALNAAITHLQEHLTGKFALGQTSQMNPGSLEDWPITEQFKLFELLGNVEELAGVRLTDSCLMIPPKSLSGIIFPTEVRFESCQLCQRPNCPSRRAAYDPQIAKAYGIAQ